MLSQPTQFQRVTLTKRDMLTIRQFDEIDQLAEIAPIWRDLLGKTEGADFFRTLDWLNVFWNYYGAEQQLKVLLVADDENPLGILPLTVSSRHSRLGTFRVLGFPLDYWGSFYGAVGPKPEAIWQATLPHLLKQPRDWDYLDLRWLNSSSDEASSVIAAAAENKRPMIERDDEEIAIADLSGGWDAYWASRSRNWRSNCRRNIKKVEATGEVEYIRYRPGGDEQGESDPRWDLFGAVESIAHRSWQASSTDGTTLTHEGISGFLRDMHIAAARGGNLDLNLLTIDGKPAAFNYNYHFQGYVSSLRLGFDPDFAKLGVGTMLTHRMLEDSCARGDHTFDFLPGSLSVKRPWQTQTMATQRLEHLPLISARSNVLRAGRWIRRNLKAAATLALT